MSEWPMVKLGELLKPSPKKTAGELDAPILSITMHEGLVEQDNRFKKRIASLDTSIYRVVFKGQLVVGFPIDEGVLDFQDKYSQALVSPAYGVWDLVSDEVTPEFLGLFLKSPRAISIYKSRLRGTTARRRSLPTKVFQEIEFLLPPLGEQKRIAEILGGVANVIHTVEQQIETANQLEKSLFNQFRRQYSALCSPIKNICKVQTGATPSRKNSAYYDGGVPWVKTGEVNGGKIEETEEYITELAVQETNCRKFPIGTILVAMYGQGATRGKVGILNCAAATNQACAALIALACEDQEYIFAVLRNCYDELRNLGRGGTQPNLNLTLVKEFEIPWPEEFAREEFSQKWRELDNLRHLLHRKLSLLQELQKSLATRAFAGLL